MAKKTQHVAGSHIVETQKPYELMLVFKPDILENALEKKLKEFEAFLTENDGLVEVKDIWGKRDLAYKIKQYEQGNYVAYNLMLPSTFLQELDENLRINNDIMRHLVISLKESYSYQKPSAAEVVVTKPTENKESEKETGSKEVKKDKPKKEDPSKSLDDKLSSILSDDSMEL